MASRFAPHKPVSRIHMYSYSFKRNPYEYLTRFPILFWYIPPRLPGEKFRAAWQCVITSHTSHVSPLLQFTEAKLQALFGLWVQVPLRGRGGTSPWRLRSWFYWTGWTGSWQPWKIYESIGIISRLGQVKLGDVPPMETRIKNIYIYIYASKKHIQHA